MCFTTRTAFFITIPLLFGCGQNPNSLSIASLSDATSAIATVPAKTDDAGRSNRGVAHARVTAAEIDFDFGLMDPDAEGEHIFVVKNEGVAPLKLSDGGTTCKCTLADLPQHEIQPGDEIGIRVTWRTSMDGEFRQVATVRTNDPLKTNIKLTIEGLVRRQFGVYPTKLTFETVSLDCPDKRTCLVYSQVWDQFELSNLQSDWRDLEWKVRPVSQQEIEQFVPDSDVRSAYFVEIDLPNSAEPGFFNHWLRMDAYGPSPDAKQTLEAKLVGKVLRRLCVYGDCIESNGVLDGGVLREGQGKRMSLMMKVRDAEKDMEIVGIKTEPEFIKASVRPRGIGDVRGLYTLDVEIPKDAPPGYHMGLNTGKLLIQVKHPRIQELDLGVKFCIVKR